jgi:hypothetical protein
MTTKNSKNQSTPLASAIGLSNAELETEHLSELPEREEMSGCYRWCSWNPCYPYPCYSTSSVVVTSYSSATTFTQIIR